jgi:phage gpG-like protein
MPASTFINIEMLGAEETRRWFLRGEMAIEHTEPAMQKVADDMMYCIGVNFSSEGRRGGGSWAHLSEQQVKRKAARGQHPEILIGWGALHDSVTQRGDPDQELEVTDEEVNLGSSLDYAGTHQYGMGHIPARPYLEFVAGDYRRWAQIIEDHVIEAMGHTGRIG